MPINPLSEALAAGHEIREVVLRNGRFYFNVIDVIEHEEMLEVVYDYRGEILSLFVSPEEVESVQSRPPRR